MTLLDTDYCFQPVECVSLLDEETIEETTEETIDEVTERPGQITNNPHFDEKCNQIAEILKDSYCQLFDVCHFTSEKFLDRCAKTCHGTLEFENWPEEGCGKKLKIKKGNKKTKVCKKTKKGKNKKKKDCVKLIN